MQFSTDTYFIQLKSKTSDTSVFEQGKYVIKNRKITLTPQVKIQCENKRGPIVVDDEIFYPCAGIGADYHNGFYIHRDTISETDLNRLGFVERDYFILKSKDKFILTNKSKIERFYQQ